MYDSEVHGRGGGTWGTPGGGLADGGSGQLAKRIDCIKRPWWTLLNENVTKGESGLPQELGEWFGGRRWKRGLCRKGWEITKGATVGSYAQSDHARSENTME